MTTDSKPTPAPLIHITLTQDSAELIKSLLAPSYDPDAVATTASSLYEQLIHCTTYAADMQVFYVSEYEESLVYGGPEEGGWWYYNTSLLDYCGYSTLDEAITALSELLKDNGASVSITPVNNSTDNITPGYLSSSSCTLYAEEIIEHLANPDNDTFTIYDQDECPSAHPIYVIERYLGSMIDERRRFYE